MPSFGPYYLNATEVDTITNLFIYRSGTAEQVTFMIQPELAVDFSTESNRKSTYTGRVKYIAKTLSGLVRKGLVNQMKTVHSKKYIFYLSNDGLNIAYTILGIEDFAAKVASGWNGDFGYFEYALYKPSQERFIHHDQAVNFHIKMRYYTKVNDHQYDFIDNRYASREFYSERQGKKIKRYFRPDGEFKIGSKHHYWLEIDMSTERGEKLADKFETYKEYIDYISEGISFEDMNETPRSIIFHSSATYIHIRWLSVLNAFMSKMNQYTPLINFRLTNNSTLEHAFKAEINRERHQAQVFMNIQNYSNKESGFTGVAIQSSFIKLRTTDEKTLGWSPSFLIVHKEDGSSQLLLFERLEGMESLGIARIIDLNKKLGKLEIGRSGHITEIIPILYYFDNAPEDPPFRGAGLDVEMRKIFGRLILHDAKNNLWFDGIDNKPINSNPLMYRI